MRSVISDGSGGLYVCGHFSILTEKPTGTQVPRTGIAHILANGQVDRAWNPVVADGPSFSPMPPKLNALALDNGILYLAGAFTFINNTSRTGIAALTAATGALTAWNPNPTTMTAFPFPPSGYGRESENIIAQNGRIYSESGGTNPPSPFGVGIFAENSNLPFAQIVNPIPNAQSLAVANGIVYVGGWGVKAFDAQTGAAVTTFAISPLLEGGFSRMTALAVYGNTLFAGGFITDIPSTPLTYRNIIAFNATTGQVLPMDIRANQTVLSLAIHNNILYAGGGFTEANGQPRTFAAAFNPNDGSLLPFAPQIEGDATQVPHVNSFAFAGDVVFMGGSFAMVDGRPANSISGSASASVQPPTQPVTAITFTNPLQNGTGYTVSWTPPANAPTGYVVVAVEGTTPSAGTPQNGESYTASALFTGTPTPPFSGQVVYDGTGTSVNITGLTPNTNYTFIVYAFNGSGIARTYGASASATGRTSDITPPAVATHPGIITVSSATINFGDVALNTSRTRRYTMYCTNLTTASVLITPPLQSEISVGGAPFSAAPVVFATRATIDQVDIRVRYTPSANGNLAGAITHIAGSTGASATLSGTSSPPSVNASTLSLNFGAVVPSSTATRTLRVRYRNLATRSITLTPPPGFSISTTGTAPYSNAPLTVQTGISGAFNVYAQFSPPNVGQHGGNISIANLDVPIIAVVVEGEGELPRPGVSVQRLDFGEVPIGTCKLLSYVLTPAGNIGEQVTVLCPVAFSDVEYSLDGPAGPFQSGCRPVYFSRLNGVTSVRVWVRYCPSAESDLTTALSHTSQPGGQFVQLPILGRGVRPEITVLNPTVNFGDVNVGSTAASVLRVRYRNVTPTGTITISTTASHPFLFDNLVSGVRTNLVGYATTATSSGATFSVRVTFAPTAPGLVRTTLATVLVAPNGTATDNFTLIGRGIGSSITANNNQNLNFGQQFLLTPTTRSFPLRYDNITTATITIPPTNHPEFLLMDPQTGVFTTTAGITLNVGGTPTSPVTSTATLVARFLPTGGGGNTLRLNIVSAPVGGSTSASETLTLSGTGLAPMVNVTIGTVAFGQIDLGQTRFFTYTMTYRNITASTITVDVPAGSDFALTQVSSGTWTTAGQQLTIPTVQPPTTATTQVQFWVRYTPTIAQAASVTLRHSANGGDPRTVDADNLVLTARKPVALIELSERSINFGTVGINSASTATYFMRWQNIGSPITITLPTLFAARRVQPTSSGVEQYSTDTFTFTPPSGQYFGEVGIQLRYLPVAEVATGNLTVSHTATGTTGTVLNVRGRCVTDVFDATPNPIAFTVSTNAFATSGTYNYVLDIGGAVLGSREEIEIRISSSPGFLIQVGGITGGTLPYRERTSPPVCSEATNECTLSIPSRLINTLATQINIPITITAFSNGLPSRMGIIRHTIAQRTLDVPVTATFVGCPQKIDTISILALYTEAARDGLAALGMTVKSRIEASIPEYDPVFKNSRINHLTTKYVNPEGELIRDEELDIEPTQIGETSTVYDFVLRELEKPQSRIYKLRERLKADAIVVFGWPDANWATLGNYVPPRSPLTQVSMRLPGVPSAQGNRPEGLAYIVLHELGHLASGNHEPGAVTGSGGTRYPDAQGLIREGTRIVDNRPQVFTTGTIMFHGGGTGRAVAERIPYWSNPNITITVNDQLTVGGPIIPSPMIIGTSDQNMSRVISSTGTMMANLYTSSLNPTITGPSRIVFGNPGTFVASVCTGQPPYLYQWTATTMPGNQILSGMTGSGGQSFMFTMPANVGGVRLRLIVRDAQGVESVVEQFVEAASSLVVANLFKNSASLSSANGLSSSAKETATLNGSMTLEQNYPNPWSKESEVAFSLPMSDDVSLVLYDALGREIMTIARGHFRAGRHSFVLTSENLASGVYTYRLRTTQTVLTKTMVIVK
ncbi:MAG: T9SS type A sorting domain-containing protein [Candidatus Kapabacteria bacterium]|nr:T9SS type A sorting domain-containing protein [Candidatus Kapabacteria bacterium]